MNGPRADGFRWWVSLMALSVAVAYALVLIQGLAEESDKRGADVRALAEQVRSLGGTPVAGEDGVQGPPGRDGTDGGPGPTGVPGRDGMTGPVGRTGVRGPLGPTGAPGRDGATGPSGPTGPAGGRGADGHDGADGNPGPTCPNGYEPVMMTIGEPPGDYVLCKRGG